MLSNHYTRLNDLTDEHVRVLASSPYLGNLAYLDLEDNTALTPRALDHLALSPHLRSLSHVRHDVYTYGRQWGEWGAYQRALAERRTVAWADALEVRHGYLPWLHADELYGTPTPDVEAVVEHPVGLAAFRLDLTARRRPSVPPALAAAIVDCLDASGSLRQQHLDTRLPGTGALDAILERSVLDPALPDLVALVTLTIHRTFTAFPLYDVATHRVVEATARTRVTLAIPRAAHW